MQPGGLGTLVEGPGRGSGRTGWGGWGWQLITEGRGSWGHWAQAPGDTGMVYWRGLWALVQSRGYDQHELGTVGTFPPTAPSLYQTPEEPPSSKPPTPGSTAKLDLGGGPTSPEVAGSQPQGRGEAGGWPALGPPPAEALTPGAAGLLISARCRFKGVYLGRLGRGGSLSHGC